MTANTITKVSISLVAMIAAYIAVGAFFAHADAAPIITSTIRDSSTAENVITSAHIGASVHSVVKVASSTSQALPQGTVDFNVYANTSCTGTASSVQGGVALVNGFATSTASTIGAAGLSYKAHYNGDNANIAADGPCTSLIATSNTSAVSIGLSSNNITAGQSVNGTSSLSGVTGNASGTVAYTVYSNSGCSTPFGGAGNVNVTNGSVPNSPPFQFLNAGTFYWQAVYSGDLNNSAATSTCANGILTVQAVAGKNSPSISTTLSSTSIQTGTSITASSALSGATSNASGTVAYKVFSDSACSNLFANAGVKNVVNAGNTNSDSIQFNTAGTYYWRTIYSGDSQNNSATSSCGAILSVAVAGSTTPPAGAGVISGTVFNDKNNNEVRDSGEEGLAGFTINLYNSANFNNKQYDPIYASAVTDSNGNYSFNGLANGTYSVEQLVKNGWKQTTDDFSSVVISSSAGVSGRNFGDMQKTNAGNDCKVREQYVGHGKHKGWAWGKHKKDCSNMTGSDNHATSTKPWWNNASSTKGLIFRSLQDLGNGLHIGVVVGKNKQVKDSSSEHGNRGKHDKDNDEENDD